MFPNPMNGITRKNVIIIIGNHSSNKNGDECKHSSKIIAMVVNTSFNKKKMEVECES